MRFAGRRVVLWDRSYLSLAHWRDLRAAARRAMARVRPDASVEEVVAELETSLAVEQMKRRALDEGCTPCREHLTALAASGQADDVKAWLISSGLVAAEEFVGRSR